MTAERLLTIPFISAPLFLCNGFSHVIQLLQILRIGGNGLFHFAPRIKLFIHGTDLFFHLRVADAPRAGKQAGAFR